MLFSGHVIIAAFLTACDFCRTHRKTCMSSPTRLGLYRVFTTCSNDPTCLYRAVPLPSSPLPMTRSHARIQLAPAATWSLLLHQGVSRNELPDRGCCIVQRRFLSHGNVVHGCASRQALSSQHPFELAVLEAREFRTRACAQHSATRRQRVGCKHPPQLEAYPGGIPRMGGG